MRRKIPDWRIKGLHEVIDVLGSMHQIMSLTPEPGDSDEVLHVKRIARESVERNCRLQADKIALAIDERAKRGADGRPYRPDPSFTIRTVRSRR